MRVLALCIALAISSPAWAQRAVPTMGIGAPTSVPTSTVAGLPVCNAATIGWTYLVTNALLPVLGSAVAGSGAVSVLVKCNGTTWLVGQ